MLDNNHMRLDNKHMRLDNKHLSPIIRHVQLLRKAARSRLSNKSVRLDNKHMRLVNKHDDEHVGFDNKSTRLGKELGQLGYSAPAIVIVLTARKVTVMWTFSNTSL